MVEHRIQIDVPANLKPEHIENAISDALKNSEAGLAESVKAMALDDDVTTYTRPASDPAEVFFAHSPGDAHEFERGTTPINIAEPSPPEARLISVIEVIVSPDNPNSARLYFTEDGEALRESGSISARELRAERARSNQTLQHLKEESDTWHGWAEEHFRTVREERDKNDDLKKEVEHWKEVAGASNRLLSGSTKALGAANRLLARAAKIVGSPTARPKLEQGKVLRWVKAFASHKKKIGKLGAQ